jgi:hypothetical protein
VVVSVFSYQQRGGTKNEGSSSKNDSIQTVLPDSSSGHKAKDATKDSIKMDSLSPKGNSNVRVDNAENVVNPKILKPTTKP